MAEDQTKDAAGAGKQEQASDLKQKIDSINACYDEVAAARRRAKWIRLATILLILAVVLGQAWRGYAMAKRTVTDDLDELMVELRPQLQVLAESTTRQMRGMAQRLIPVYREEVALQMETEWPAMRAVLFAEAETFRDNISLEIPALIESKVDAIAKRQEDLIRKEFGIEDEETLDRVITNLEMALRSSFLDVSEEYLLASAERIRRTNSMLVNFLPPERQPGFEQRVQDAWDVVSIKLGEALPTDVTIRELAE